MSGLPAESNEITVEEYLEGELVAEIRHEYVDGHVYAMASGSGAHSLLGASIIGALRNAFGGRGCHVFSSDMKVRSEEANSFRYPDASALCGEPQYSEESDTVLINPSLIVEVLSDSTQRLDRTTKFLEYQKIPTFREYVLVSQHSTLIEVLRLDPESGIWAHYFHANLSDEIHLTSVDAKFTVKDIYDGVKLTEDSS